MSWQSSFVVSTIPSLNKSDNPPQPLTRTWNPALMAPCHMGHVLTAFWCPPSWPPGVSIQDRPSSDLYNRPQTTLIASRQPFPRDAPPTARSGLTQKMLPWQQNVPPHSSAHPPGRGAPLPTQHQSCRTGMTALTGMAHPICVVTPMNSAPAPSPNRLWIGNRISTNPGSPKKIQSTQSYIKTLTCLSYRNHTYIDSYGNMKATRD